MNKRTCPDRTVIYLASPYSDPDPEVRAQRYLTVREETARLMREGVHVFAPIVYGHPLVEAGAPDDREFWMAFDEAMIAKCHELWVLEVPGWEQSVGVVQEIRWAYRFDIPIRFLTRGETP